MSREDPYVYPGTEVLRNRFHIRDVDRLRTREQFISATVMTEMRREPVTGAFDLDRYKHIHRRLFERVYEWAGQTRTIDVWKTEVVLQGRSVSYSLPDTIKADATNALGELHRIRWSDLADRRQAGQFAAAIGELWRAHPFREGNTRTLLVFVEQFTRTRNLALDQAILNQVPSETRDALAQATTGYVRPLAELVARARRSESHRAHPELGRLTSEATEVLRLLGRPRIVRPEVGTEVRGQVLATSYDHVLIQDSRQVAAVPRHAFAQPPANNQRVTVQVLEPGERAARVSTPIVMPVAVIARAEGHRGEIAAGILIPSQPHEPLRPDAIAARLVEHPEVRDARAVLVAAAARVFRSPEAVVKAFERQILRGDPVPSWQPPQAEELLGSRRPLLGGDSARTAALNAIPDFRQAIRTFQSVADEAAKGMKGEHARRAERDRVAIPAPSAALSAALATRKPQEIAGDAALMPEIHALRIAFHARFGRPGTAILADSSREKAAALLPEGHSLDGTRALLRPLREAVLAEQKLTHAQYRSKALSQDRPGLDQAAGP